MFATRKFVNSFGFDFKKTKDVIKPKEIDMYDPKAPIAIEYCGNRFHTEAFGRHKTYHQEKFLKCKKLGIKLVTIFSDEWNNRKEQTKAKLKLLLEKSEKINFLEIDHITDLFLDHEESSNFLKENCIDKKDAYMSFGVRSKEEPYDLIAVATCNRKWEISIHFKNGYEVIGAAKELFKTALAFCEHEAELEKLNYISDNRYPEEFQEELNLTFEKELPPKAKYVNLNNSNKRYSTKPKNCESSKIWDCGYKKYTYKIKQD